MQLDSQVELNPPSEVLMHLDTVRVQRTSGKRESEVIGQLSGNGAA